ncbi:MAG: hypothetical protein WCK59_01140 [Candidatus Falkowbacteria bacterium]
MDLNQAIKNIDRSIIKRNPQSFHPNWIKYRCKVSYKYIVDNIKDEFNQTDWDLVISQLQRYNQRLWLKNNNRTRTPVVLYEDKEELDVVLNRYQEKFYTFISRENKDDKIICDRISIKLVRLSQKGNILARDKVLVLLRYLADYWVEFDKSFFNWKGYNDLVDSHISACTRRFRYAGSFIGYLYRTLEYSGRGLVPLEKFSLDDYILDSKKRVIDKLVISK